MNFFDCDDTHRHKERMRLMAWFQRLDAAIRRAIIMKLNFLLLLTLLCLGAKAQMGTVSLSVKQAPLVEVLEQIHKQTGYKLLYNSKHFEQARPVTLTLTNSTLETALNKCFEGQPVSYEFINKTILIKPKPQPVKEKKGNPGKRTISGTVADETGSPLSGVTIKIKGTLKTILSGNGGRFDLEVPDENVVLVFSSVGFVSQEMTVGNRTTITVLLKEDAALLNQVQIIGYGTTTKRLSTGSIGTVKAVDLERQPVTNPLAALQGRVPGLVITQTSGVPGSAFKVQLRGQSALDMNLSKNDPLFVIDGVPFETGNAVTSQLVSAANNPVSASNGGLSALNAINPQDIESIDVLKDADATSIYGSRGANGVILITTKKGWPGKTAVSLNVSTGFSRPGRLMPMLNTQQYVQTRKEAFKNDGLIPSASSNDPGYAPDIMLWDTTRYTNFRKLLIGKTAVYNNFQGAISGGNELTQYRLGGTYNRQTTVYAGGYADQIGSGSASLTSRSANGKFNLQFSAIYSSEKNRLPGIDLTKFINSVPNLLLYNSQGGLAWSDQGVDYNSLEGGTNPLASLNLTYLSNTQNLSTNLNLSYKVLKELTLKSNFGYNAFNISEHSTQPSSSYDPVFTGVMFPSAYWGNAENKNWIVEPQLTYTHTFDFGKLDALLGLTFQSKSGKNQYINGSNYQSDLLLNSMRAAGNLSASNDAVLYRYNAFFGRINYSYQDKYIINLTGRRDGSSRFGPSRQWATFGAVGLAWIFTSESFLKDKIPFLSFGKLRGSYGTTGNDQIGDYNFLNLWTNSPYSYNGIPGLNPASLYNPEYNWEVNKKLEASLELGLFKDRLLFETTYYRNRSSNQLIRYSLPTQTGFTNVIRNFPGLVQNSGWELSVNTKNFATNHFSWTTALNLSIPRNKLISFPGLATSSYGSRYVEGKSLTVIRAFKYLGVDPQKGIYTFEDVNKDGMLTTTADYQVFGNLDPKFTGGLQNNFVYKNFDLSYFFQFTKQTGANYISQLASAPPGSMYNQPEIVLGRWQKPGDIAEIQKVNADFFGEARGAIGYLSLSNGAYTDASYIKLKNVSFAYRLPTTLVSKAGINSCKIYLQMENVLTFTRYKGSDPETQNFYALPPLRTIVAGIQLNL